MTMFIPVLMASLACSLSSPLRHADPIKSKTNIFGFWTTKHYNTIQIEQIRVWCNTISLLQPKSDVWLIVFQTEVLLPLILQIRGINILVLDGDMSRILVGTPLKFKVQDIRKIPTPQLSDAVRIACLFKWGGSWIDIDDILVRPILQLDNVLAVAEFGKAETSCRYEVCRFSEGNLLSGQLVSPSLVEFQLHVQNDPMINWHPQHPFLWRWMEEISLFPDLHTSWGQKIPTDLVYVNNSWVTDHSVNLLGQHLLLMHPAYAIKGKGKGPLFPPHDLRAPNLPAYDDYIDETEFRSIFSLTLKVHSYFAVKNSKLTGIIQKNKGLVNRWFVGWLVEEKWLLYAISFPFEHSSLNLSISRTSVSFSDGPEMFDVHSAKVGKFPLVTYNPSVVRIPPSAWLPLCMGLSLNWCSHGQHMQEDVIAISWFSKLPRHRMGCLIWLGVTTPFKLKMVMENDTEKNSFWLVPPKLVQDVLGPKLADPRLAIVNLNGNLRLALVGFSKLAPHSDLQGTPDYSARVAVISANDKTPECICNQSALDVKQHLGCFPKALQCCISPFVPELQESRKGSFALDCTTHLCLSAHSHKSRLLGMPLTQKLPGVEIAFSNRSAPSLPSLRTPAKNVVPVQFGFKAIPLNLAFFVDFSPAFVVNRDNKYSPIISAIDLRNGHSKAVWSLEMDGTCGFLDKKWRGSTQVVAMHHGGRKIRVRTFRDVTTVSPIPDEYIFATIVHKRIPAKTPKYIYKLVLISSKQIELDQQLMSVPSICVACITFDVPSASSTFTFVTGLTSFDGEHGNSSWTFLYSFGINDKIDAFSSFSIELFD